MDDRGSPSESFGGDEPPAKEQAVVENRDWADLPADVLSVIFRKIGSIEIMMAAQFVCRAWRRLAWYPETWRCIDMTGRADLFHDIDMVGMTMQAIDRSGGLLEEFCMDSCGGDELMRYIGERTDRLRRLQLISCYDISDEALIDIAKRSPQLEVLEISLSKFSEEVYAPIGQACQNLKHLQLNAQWSHSFNFQSDEEAVAIANNMQGLRHLQLVGNMLTNEGLHAILDKCSQLESLDIRRCFNVRMDDSLQRKCSKIRVLKLPDDSTNDCAFLADVDEIDSLSDDCYYGSSDIDEVYDDYSGMYYDYSDDYGLD